MCHYSCATCSSSTFNSCLSCYGTNILFQGSCYCSTPWNTSCTSQSSFQQIFRLFNSFFILSFILLFILYCLKTKLPLSYRVLSGLQGMSILLYSPLIYLDYQDFYILKLFNLLSGPWQITYRLENISTNHAIQTYILLGFFIFLLIVLYYPSKTFHKQSESFCQYLKQNIIEYLQNFYYFGGKMMFFYIGYFIKSQSSQILMIVHLAIFCILILATFIRLIYEYHHNSLNQQIFQGPLYIYVMLANGAMIGISLITESSMLIVLYSVPLGLLILIAILNKDMKINDKNTIKFFIIEIIMNGLSICIILLNDLLKTYILLIALCLSVLVFIFQLSFSYYGGIDLSSGEIPVKGSNKIHPMPESINNISVDDQAQKKEISQQKSQINKKKGKYF